MNQCIDRALFDRAWNLLRVHSERKGETVEQTLNRLFVEQLALFGPSYAADAPRIWEHNLEPCCDTWSVDQLRRLRPKHSRADPDRFGDPIIVVEYRDRLCLVDGSTRANVAVRDSEAHDVIVMKVMAV